MSETIRDRVSLTDQQIETAGALSASLWPGKDKDEVLATYFDLIRSPEAAKRIMEWVMRDGEQEIASGKEIDPAFKATREALLPALLHVEKQYMQIPRQWTSVYRRSLGGSEPVEIFEERKGSGLAQIRPRRTPSVVDGKAGRRVHTYFLDSHDIGLAVRINRSTIDDGSFLAIFGASALGLAESFWQTEEVLHANLFNTGNVYNAQIGGDGCPLFSTHPLSNSTYSNVCDLQLNESGLEYVAQRIRVLPDAAGLKMFARPVKLIVPIELEMCAARLFHDNPLLNKRFPEGYVTLDFLTNSKAWFVQTTVAGLRSIEKNPFRLDFVIDGDDLLLDGSQSYGVGYNNPRACFASFPKEAA